MKKEDNNINIKLYQLIADKTDHKTIKLYFNDYNQFLKELKVYICLGYTIQVARIERVLYL